MRDYVRIFEPPEHEEIINMFLFEDKLIVACTRSVWEIFYDSEGMPQNKLIEIKNE